MQGLPVVATVRLRWIVLLAASHAIVFALLLDPGMGMAVPGMNIRVKRSQVRKPLAACLVCLFFPLFFHPVIPITEPSVVVLALFQVDIEIPADGDKPLGFERVELGDGESADL